MVAVFKPTVRFPFPHTGSFPMQNSLVSHQPKNGRKPRAPAMQKTDASKIPVQWSVFWGEAPKAEGPLSSPTQTFDVGKRRPISICFQSQPLQALPNPDSHKRPDDTCKTAIPRAI